MLSRQSFLEFFMERCRIAFILENGKVFKWGYTLSYQKGMEIKELIEQKMKEEIMLI